MFIVFEGGEGSGKTTQVRLLAEYLCRQRLSVLTTKEPYGVIREMLLRKEFPLKTEILLFAADRALHVDSVIRPALARGEIVICDRYTDSTLAYQGAGLGADMSWLQDLSKWTTGNLQPDHVFILDVPYEVGMSRIQRRGKLDVIEERSLDFHRRVYEWYSNVSGERYHTISGLQDPLSIHHEIIRNM